MGRQRRLSALVAGLLVVATHVRPAIPEEPVGLEAALAEGESLAIEAVPVEVVTLSSGPVPAGAWRLRAANPSFGGLSGIEVIDGRLIAVSDKGFWLSADLRVSGSRLTLRDARMAPMRDATGEPYDKAGGDAEGLTLWQGFLAVSFERDHRVMRLEADGRMGRTIHSRLFERLRSNAGIEALATLPDGRLIGLAEGRRGGAVRLYLMDAAGKVDEHRLALRERRPVTGADVGPDGRLYLLLRHFSPLAGVSVRVLRLRLNADGLPDPAGAETLLSFDPRSGIDNMEGIAVEEDGAGRLWLWLISDDNYSLLQRTLLLRFRVLD